MCIYHAEHGNFVEAIKYLISTQWRCVICLQDRRILRSYGYNLRGQRARIRRRYLPWGPRIAAILIICNEGLLDVGLYEGHVNGETFLTFVNNVLTPCLPNPRSVVILGNLISLTSWFCLPIVINQTKMYSYYCINISRFLQIVQLFIIPEKLLMQ